VRSGSGGRWFAVVALCFVFFVIQLDVTVVNVALVTIRHELGGNLGDQQWIVDSYTVVLAAGMLTAGAMGDRLGSRRICVTGLIMFALGSALCSLAPDMSMLILARAVQGLGAAAGLPCSLALIVQQFPDPRRRAHALGLWGGISSVGLAAGPVLGGALIALADWRAIFLVNVPLCAVAAVIIRARVAEAPRYRATKLDPGGLVLGTVALASVTGGLIEAGQLGWENPVPLALIAGGALIAAVFTCVEYRHSAPMLPLRIFAGRRFSAAAGAGLIFNFCLYGALLCVSVFLQGPLGQSALRTGMFLLPLAVAVGLGSSLSGRLTARLGPRIPMLTGYAAGAAGAVVLLAAGRSGPPALVVCGTALLGFCSIAMPAMTSVAMSTADPRRTGLASGVLNTARQAGGALGAAVLGTLLTVHSGSPGMSLTVPMAVAIAAYAVAIGCTILATSRRAREEGGQ
jgi:DHA2 family methylenomycin A resistance protein-like MFS transporter